MGENHVEDPREASPRNGFGEFLFIVIMVLLMADVSLTAIEVVGGREPVPAPAAAPAPDLELAKCVRGAPHWIQIFVPLLNANASEVACEVRTCTVRQRPLIVLGRGRAGENPAVGQRAITMARWVFNENMATSETRVVLAHWSGAGPDPRPPAYGVFLPRDLACGSLTAAVEDNSTSKLRTSDASLEGRMIRTSAVPSVWLTIEPEGDREGGRLPVSAATLTRPCARLGAVDNEDLAGKPFRVPCTVTDADEALSSFVEPDG